MCPAWRVQLAAVREHAHEHDGAGHRQRQAEDDGRRPRPSEGVGGDRAESGRDAALRDRARNGDPPDGQQLLEVELQPDAEHQQDDADFGELLGDLRRRRRSRACWARRRRRPAGSRRSATGRAAA